MKSERNARGNAVGTERTLPPALIVHSLDPATAYARSRAGTVQKNPDARIPPLLSCTWVAGVPVPGTKRSIQMKPNVPKRRCPVLSM